MHDTDKGVGRSRREADEARIVQKKRRIIQRANSKAGKAVSIVALLYVLSEHKCIQPESQYGESRGRDRLAPIVCCTHLGFTQLSLSSTAPSHSAWQARQLGTFGRKAVWEGGTHFRLTQKSRAMHDSSPAEPASYPIGHASET